MKLMSLRVGILLGCVSLMMTLTQAQHCATTEYVAELEKQFPGIKASMDKSYMKAVGHASKSSHYKLPPIDTILEIPVVFHLVYRTPKENISDELIMDQLKVLNDAYNRTNADTVNTREIFQPVAGSARIKFVLATSDPEGNPTNGITRTVTTRATFNVGTITTTDYVKQTSQRGKNAWDTKKYLNIWICNLNRSNGTRSLFGYAFPPINADFWDPRYYRSEPFHGVVLHYEIVGTDNPSNLSNTLYTNEKTAVHEVGHFLGLRHIWGDPGWGQNGCLIDDFIDDTPPSLRATTGCNYGTNTCNQDNLPDQMENYMDYSSANCTNMFTKQQIDVMRYNLANLRSDLASEILVEEERPNIPGDIIYPNPFHSELSISLNDPEFENITVTFYDILGRELFKHTQQANAYLLHVPTEGIMIGMYYVEVYSETKGTLIESKVIKTH